MPGQAQQPPSRDRIRACSIALSSGSQLLGNLQWSELGQALVVTDDNLVILSPLASLHPTLAGQSRSQDVESHPNWQGRFPHTVIQVNIKTFSENEHSIRSRTILESDHSAVDPRFVNVQWTSASWSKADLGPHGSCLILATTSELDLFILGAPRNAWTGEWTLLHSVDLGPVAGLTQLDEPPPGQDRLHRTGDKSGFTRGRALMRKKQLATEMLCAAFIDVPQAARDQVGSPDGFSSPRATSTYVVAGTGSGHIAVYRYDAGAGHCTLVTASTVSNTAIEKLAATTQVEAQVTDAHARIAFQDASGVQICDFYAHEDQPYIQLSAVSPILAQPLLISSWLWYRHQLIFATVGQVHVSDTWTGHQAVFELITDPDSTYDPYALAVCMRPCSDSQSSVDVVLQDLRQYRIPLQPRRKAKSAHARHTLSATDPAPLSGYPPLTEKLQQRHDQHQTFLAYHTDPSSELASTVLVGAIRTDERIAFLGYNVSETLRYQMEVIRGPEVTPERLLDEELARLHHGDGAGTSPYLVARLVLAFLFTSDKPDDFRGQLLTAIEHRWRSLLDVSSSVRSQTSQIRATQRAQQRLLFILASRLESQDQAGSSLETLSKEYKATVLCDWLHQWLRRLVQRMAGSQASPEDRKLLQRLITAGQNLPHPNRDLAEACKDASSASALPPHGSRPEAGNGSVTALTDETCVACETRLSISWDDSQQNFGWAKCQKGHVWPRCSVSLATISDREVRVCIACWAKSLTPDKSEQSPWQTLMLEEASRCLYCGSCWILR